jgi:predicted nucleotidyltransferase
MKQQTREIALEKFLQKWENKKGVIGAIVCGSYITGNPSKHSDIDIHIIMDEKATRREKGNEIIDGILIEYFINPISKLHKYIEEDFKKGSRLTAHMLATGKILFDSTGKIQKLKQEGEKCLTKKYTKLSTMQIELLKYHLWDSLDNLEEIYEAK